MREIQERIGVRKETFFGFNVLLVLGISRLSGFVRVRDYAGPSMKLKCSNERNNIPLCSGRFQGIFRLR